MPSALGVDNAPRQLKGRISARKNDKSVANLFLGRVKLLPGSAALTVLAAMEIMTPVSDHQDLCHIMSRTRQFSTSKEDLQIPVAAPGWGPAV
jgi:hypothetical protein